MRNKVHLYTSILLLAILAFACKDTEEPIPNISTTPSLRKGELWFLGDIYGKSLSNNFILVLADSAINMENLSGNADILMLELNTELTDTFTISNGTYAVSSYTNNQLTPYIITPAYLTDTYRAGSWYIKSTYYPIKEGSATVQRSNNLYHLNFRFIDIIGDTIQGSFNDTLKWVDKSSIQP